AIGKVTRDYLRTDQWQALEGRTRVLKPTVNDVANDVKLGAADAGILWDATVKQYPDLEAVPLGELEWACASVDAAVLHSTTQPTAALRFARYLGARDRGLVEFQKAGFNVVQGDVWAETPELTFYGGAMLRPAVDQTINDFEQREGVKIKRVYNGC